MLDLHPEICLPVCFSSLLSFRIKIPFYGLSAICLFSLLFHL